MCRCIFGAVVALSGREGSGVHGSGVATLPGQEGSGVRLKKESDNHHVVRGGV